MPDPTQPIGGGDPAVRNCPAVLSGPAAAPPGAVDAHGAAELDSLVRSARGAPARLGGVRLIVVDGPSGSGKTRLAGALAAALRQGGERVSTLSTDLLATWREPFGFWPQLEEQVLVPLARGEQGRLQVVDWTGPEPRPGAWRRIPVPDVLVLEGVSAGRHAVRDRAGLLVWVELADRAERLERAVRRDGEHTRPLFRAWQDDEDRHFVAEGTRAAADLHVPAWLDRPVIRP